MIRAGAVAKDGIAVKIGANSVETIDNCTGEAKEPCFVCDECRWYGGDTKNPDKWKQECDEYIITEEQAKRNRKKFKIVK